MSITGKISLEEIIRRKIVYCRQDTFEDINTKMGYIRGYEEMLTDMDMTEEKFAEKYLAKICELSTVFESTDYRSNENFIDELCGYNNAIVSVLAMIDEKYRYPDLLS
ncbi:MAG: hypothetical protein K2K66_08390 [Ruminococcus sp.]|nr:hypothetical protein [Ruminococcus sp.]